jgi:uncharacterized membrane protein
MLITGATLAISIYLYPELPNTMPIHFDARGNPDGFASKNVGAFLGPGCQIFCFIILALAYYTLARPEKDRASKYFSVWGRYPPEARAVLIPRIMVFMDGLLFSLLVMFAYLQYLTDMLALGKRQTIGIGIHLFTVFILVWIVVWTVIFARVGSRFKKQKENS